MSYPNEPRIPSPSGRGVVNTATATKIEAILYLKGKPLSIGEIAEYAACDRATVEEGIIELMDSYARRDSALEVVETPNGYSLQLRTDFQDLVQTLIPVELGLGALRTLAAIALNSPILQSDLINLRGSGVYQHVPELVELGFVRKRRDNESRSYSLQVTPKFHQYFQIEQLPQLLDSQQQEQQLELDLAVGTVNSEQ
ncbi:SMC-Scp complex subunit ScpB [Anabaena azotica]|uniref:SMC-Scp complex subunit ScpB n=1 Tax=Anabaena azotica FACHB-119 TaxID=947527 RepID=A0ABR8CYP6_9NOST|nr:SMC-Scp complex subunit ScpB [Anabaena azotica]MBD2499101.1 SMC-Scp complex subunit ScpB [Anabaena azotica FACHB-119]